jgi:glycosyltransferase involved in cell wall biosynthesis
MKATVIIPSFKRPADLQRCLAAIAIQSRAADEVLVVGRNGDPDTSEIVCVLRHSLSSLRLVEVAQPGLIAALNCGLHCAAGDILAFTDDDAEPEADWLQRIENSFADASIGAVGGRDWLQLPDEPALFRPQPVARVGVVSWYGVQHGNHHCPLKGHARKVMFLKGVNMAFRRRALGSYRIDSNLRGLGAQVGSELDLCLQTRRAGFDILFDDRILVKHYSSPRTAGDDRNDLAGSVFPDISFNNHYMVAKGFGTYRAVSYFINKRLLGSRPEPGLLACLKWRFKGDRLAWRRMLATTWAGLAGFRAGRRARVGQSRASLDMRSPVIEIEGQAPGRSSN